MTKKNSLTAFKKPVSPILPTEGPAEVAGRARTGPKPKPQSEKRSHRVMLSLTPSEGTISKERAGLAGEATMIMAFLKEHGYFDIHE